jgi:hypothetical protein
MEHVHEPDWIRQLRTRHERRDDRPNARAISEHTDSHVENDGCVICGPSVEAGEKQLSS